MAKKIRDPRSRQHIVEAAWRLLATRGLGATTMRAVAAEAGVSTGSVTHYFEDKAELINAVLRHNGKVAAQRVVEAVGERRGLDAVQRATQGLLPVDEERLTCWRVWLASWSDDSSGGFTEGYQVWRSLLRRHLNEAVADGELPDGLDLPHEIGVLGTLVVGTGLLAGSDMSTRDQLRRRARRIFNEHFARLAQQRSSV
ncbi:TetR/AcrR family transcriptional regulator [Saccharopolyspora sp. NFXS83]|uniref:TetR/AcrR family transcriptional regulator n=1 Tax=Saccharopolyspora sp. NFXS83 TaxID=2993560 RepID=UPI00224A6BD0|nr:TetR/AcrR family transcriptional regulator [Saccharopolyspora sp. NFXS83]MCX2730490.1 TetR/AcrR family transcriptional regulator [Saccharopolyspora sp. NFXS83]